jgi:hypothetical protein
LRPRPIPQIHLLKLISFQRHPLEKTIKNPL